jgi:hypothetical protein
LKDYEKSCGGSDSGGNSFGYDERERRCISEGGIGCGDTITIESNNKNEEDKKKIKINKDFFVMEDFCCKYIMKDINKYSMECLNDERNSICECVKPFNKVEISKIIRTPYNYIYDKIIKDKIIKEKEEIIKKNEEIIKQIPETNRKLNNENKELLKEKEEEKKEKEKLLKEKEEKKEKKKIIKRKRRKRKII